MLIQDLNIFEQIDNLARIRGATDASSSSQQPGSNATAFSSGKFNYTETTTESGGNLSSVVASNIDIMETLQLLQDAGISVSL